MIIVLVYFKDRSSRMLIYVWDELYFRIHLGLRNGQGKLFTENAYLKK